jgi:hypothetical protein
MRKALKISIMIISCVFFIVLSKAGLFPAIPAFESILAPEPIPASEPIRVFKPIPASEKIPVGTPTTANETKYAWSYVFQWRSLLEHGQNFWVILGFLVSSFISILMCWMDYRHLRQDSYKEDETKQERPEIRKLLQKSENFMLEFRGMIAFMKELEEHRGQSQNEVDSKKTIVKVKDKRHARFQNEIESVKDMTEKLPLMLTEETVGDPAAMESPVKMGRPRKHCIVASKATGEKEKKVPMNKVRVGLAPPPNLKAVKAKVVTRSNQIHRPGESHMKICNKKLDYSKIQPKVDAGRKTVTIKPATE